MAMGETYRFSAMPAIETFDDYYAADKENGRRDSGSSTSSIGRNSLKQRQEYEAYTSDSAYAPPPVEDVYQIFRNMENRLDSLRNVIQVQKGRLNGGSTLQSGGDSIL